MGDRGGRAAGSSTGGGRGRGGAGGAGRGRMLGGWTHHPLTEDLIERLSAHFSTVVELPEEEVEEERRAWEGVSLLARSLGRRVPPEWVAKEAVVWGHLSYMPEVFPMAAEHLLIRLRSEVDCAAVLAGGPWLVAGQILAVEPWMPDFTPGRKKVNRAEVWLRLPGLPIEFWRTKSILKIASAAGRPVAVDQFTEHHRKIGFARVRIVIDAAAPLVPGTLIQGREERMWQPFVFENLPAFCDRCGRIGHGRPTCTAPVQSTGPWMAVEVPGDGLGATSQGEEHHLEPLYGPWMTTSRVRLATVVKEASDSGQASANPEQSPLNTSATVAGQPSSSHTAAQDPAAQTSAATTEVWHKPTKVARRRSPPKDRDGAGDIEQAVYWPLAIIPDSAGVPSSLSPAGPDLSAGPNVPMVDAGSGPSLLKRPRSPSTSPTHTVEARHSPPRLLLHSSTAAVRQGEGSPPSTCSAPTAATAMAPATAASTADGSPSAGGVTQHSNSKQPEQGDAADGVPAAAGAGQPFQSLRSPVKGKAPELGTSGDKGRKNRQGRNHKAMVRLAMEYLRSVGATPGDGEGQPPPSNTSPSD